MERVRAAAGFVVWLCVAGMSTRASAQGTYEVLRSLIEPAYPPIGRLLEASNGKLYGVAVQAGPAGKGAILEYERQSNGTLTATVLHAFSGPDGATPLAGVIEGSDGALYGTTAEGGPDGGGTIYRFATPGTFTVLHTFANTAGACGPAAELVERPDGFLYGTTEGSCGGDAIIFRIAKTGGFTGLHTFQRPTAFGPKGSLIDGGDGNLYGVTTEGSVPVGETMVGNGTFYSITPPGVFTVLHTFVAPGPAAPHTLIDGRDGFLYGGSTFGDESRLFRVSRTGVVSSVSTLPSEPGNSLGPMALIRGLDGSFYGTTVKGGSDNRGMMFRVTAAGAFTALHWFVLASGAAPNSVIQTSDGLFYGSTEEGGVNRRGVIFRSTATGEYSVVQSFPGTDPLQPMAPLLAGPDASLYGTSCGGGAYNAGTVFKISGVPSTLTVLHSFAYWDGSCPTGALTFGHDGAIYGTASASGIWGRGTIFRITTAGSFAPVFFFNSTTGSTPYGGLLYASDGNYYGTTFFGIGTAWAGTAFRATPGGMFTTLHVFDRVPGLSPRVLLFAPLMQAADGNIYGSTLSTPFRLSLTGTVTDFGYFAALVRGPLTEAADGNLYGTAGNDIFRLTSDGNGATVHTFSGPDGRLSYAGLRAAPDGWLYGATAAGGSNDRGTLFRFSGNGAPVTLHTFDGATGAMPFATLTVGPDGALYGTTVYGGTGDRGVIFRLTVPQ